MTSFTELLRRVRSLFRHRVREAELDQEIRFHLEMEAEKNRRLGMPVDAAARSAARAFGGVARTKEESREQRGFPRLEELLRDLRIAGRSLRRTPAFTAVAVLTLGLGVGATTAIFSVVEAVLLRPLPFPASDRLVVPRSMLRADDGSRWNVTYRDFRNWRDAGVFEHAALYQRPELDVSGGAEPIRTTLLVVTEEFFATLGVRPARGRLFQPDDYRPGGLIPVVLSNGLWRRLGSPANLAALKLRVTGIPAAVLGVLAPGEGWPQDADLFVPRRSAVSQDDLAPDNFIYWSIARLKPDQTVEATRARLDQLASAVERDFPAKRTGVTVTAQPLRDYLVGAELTRTLWVLLGAVGFVLLIACVNVANLLLARTTRRHHELALRAALGASRGRLTRQLLAESILLALPGSLLGVLLAKAGVLGLLWLAPADLPGVQGVSLDAAVLLVALGCSLFAVLLAGLAPALQGSGGAKPLALGDAGSRSTHGLAATRLRSGLVVLEVALSLTLLAGAALLIQSFRQLQAVKPGFDVSQTVTFEVSLPNVGFVGGHPVLEFWDRLLGRLESQTAVQSVSLASALPLGGGGFYLGRTMIEAGAPEPPAGPEVGLMWNVVAPKYFLTLGQALLAGRDFTARDDSLAPPVIIVNQAFAKAMFHGAPALGRRVFSWRDERVSREIVGVVEDVRYQGVADSLRPVVYIPLGQTALSRLAVIVRGRGEPRTLLEVSRRELTALNPEIAMARPRTLQQVRADSIARPRFLSLLISVFATLALLLAAIGLSGLLSYTVAQRDRELSVRIALGASRAHVVRLVLGQALLLAGAGVILGLLGALGLTRVLRSLLFGVSPGDPVALAAVALLLLAIALAASWLPARRAARADPLESMRAS
jgi:putative ABC transport system permease protein